MYVGIVIRLLIHLPKKEKKKKKSNSFPPLLVWMEDVGNSNILPIFCKKIGNMPCFETRFTQNRVQHRYKSLKRRYMQKKKKKKNLHGT